METPFDARGLRWWLLCLSLSVVGLLLVYLSALSLLAGISDVLRYRLVTQLDMSTWLQVVGRKFEEVFGYLLGLVIESLSPMDGAAWLPALVCGLVVPPLMFIALPFTRAASRVRGRHIARAAVYALSPMAAISVVGLVVGTLQHLMSNWSVRVVLDRLQPFDSDSYGMEPKHESLWLAIMMWQTVWWACAFRIGFRMNDWRQALAAVMVPTYIVQVCFMYGNINFSIVPRW